MGLSQSRMFSRLLLRSIFVRRGRSLTALLAITVAAALTTALMTLYSDIGAKLRGDFNKFGANVVITAPGGFSDDQILAVRHIDHASVFALPSAFVVAKTESGKPVVVVGTDLSDARNLNPAWSITGISEETGSALIGARAASVLASERPSLEYAGKTYDISKAGSLRTGGPEDSRVYIPLAAFEEWTGVRPTVIEAQFFGSPQQVAEKLARLQPQLPKDAVIQPVRQIVEAETRVLGKTKFILWLSVIAITLTVALCVLATLTASVLERRKDYAVMKALGSSQSRVNSIFLGETFALATVGSVVGFMAGCALAMWIGRANFHAAVEPRWLVFPHVLVASLLVALLSAIVPLALLQKLQPAAMLKGD